MGASARVSPLFRRESALALGLVALTLAVYGQVCRFEFVDFDDPAYVISNPHVLRGLSVSGIRWAFSEVHDSNWIPLTWLSLMLDATLYGSWPGGYHITNALLHVANVLLVFAIFSRAMGNPLLGALIAALTAVHPLHAESVAWISERKDVLSMLFGLLSIGAYLRYARLDRAGPAGPATSATPPGAIGALALALVLFLCSLMAKPTFVTLPFLLLLLDFWPLGRLAAGPRHDAEDGSQLRTSPSWLLLEKLPFFGASGLFCVVAVWAQASGGAMRSLSRFPFAARCLNAVLAYGLYAWRSLVPTGLAPFYPYPAPQLGMGRVMLAAVFLGAVTLIAIANARRRPFLLVGWLWYLGTLVPMIGLVQIGAQQLADRYAYLPLIGLYVAAVGVVASLVPPSVLRSRALAAAAAGVLAVYATLGFRQVSQWHDGIRLFRHALAVAEDNSVTRQGLASALFRKGELSEALVHLQRAIEMDPDDRQPYCTAGRILYAQGRLDEAAEQFHKALAIDESYVEAQHDLGLLLCARRQHWEAYWHFARAVELNPNLVEGYANLGYVCRELGNYDESIRFNEQALALDPTLLDCHRSIAACLAAEGRVDEAIEKFRYVVTRSPSDDGARAEIERLLALKAAQFVSRAIDDPAQQAGQRRD